MTYDEFIIEVKRRAQERLGELYCVCLEKVEKNNGVLLDALCMNKREMALSPTLYLNAYYDLYQESMTLDDIMDEILEVYEWNESRSDLTVGEIKDFDTIKDRIIFKLIHAEKNGSLLEHVPHSYYQDLAIVFCIYVEQKKKRFTSLIRREHLEQWKMSEQEIYDLAKRNTPLLLTAEIQDMDYVLKRIAEKEMGDSYREALIDGMLQENENRRLMYVLSKVCFSTGGRRGEIIAMRWKNVDRQKHTIFIDKSFVHGEDGEVFKDPKSESSIRKIPLPVSVMEELKIGYIHYKEKRLAYGKGFVDSGFIFCKENGEPYKLSTIAKRYNRFLKRNGFRHIKFHNVRVSQASILAYNNVSPKTIQKILGHSLLYSVL